MEKRMNKKGQDLSIGTLILIVLGIVVLVLLILGFSLGWGNLWEKINIFGGGSSLGDVSQACALAVTSNNVYDYCSNFKQVTVNGNKEYVNCEDTRVQSGFEGRLTCTGTTAQQRIDAQCKSLITSGDARETTKVNTQLCWGKFVCSDFNAIDKTNNLECTNGELKVSNTLTCCVAP